MPPDRKGRKWGGQIAWIALVLVAVFAIGDAALAPTPTPRQPDFIDTILASRSVIAAIRLAILFAAVFVVLSVVALISQRRWLTRVGPVEVSERVSVLDSENKRLKEKLTTAEQTIEHLENQAAYSQQLVNRGDGV